MDNHEIFPLVKKHHNRLKYFQWCLATWKYALTIPYFKGKEELFFLDLRVSDLSKELITQSSFLV